MSISNIKLSDWLDKEKVVEILQDKPKWVTCATLLGTLVLISISSIAIGVFIGYTYCYLERTAKPILGRVSTNIHIINLPMLPNATFKNHTINSAIMSSALVSTILHLNEKFMNSNKTAAWHFNNNVTMR